MTTTPDPSPSTRTQPQPSAHDFAEEARAFAWALRRGWRFMAIAIVTCLTIAILSLATTRRVYQAGTRLLILQQGGRPLNVANKDPGRSLEGADDYIPTQAMILRSPLVVGQAIESIGLGRLPSIVGDDDPTQEAIRRLSVTRPDRLAKVLQVEYQARSREEAVRVVSAVAVSYRKFIEASYQKNNGEVVALITRAREDLGTELGRLEAKYLEFRRTSPLLTADESGRPFIVRRLEHWDRAVDEAMVKSIQLEMQLDLGRKLSDGGTGMWAVAHAMNQVGGDSGSNLVAQAAGASQPHQSDYLRQLAQEQQQLAERYGPNYSKVRDVQEQIARIQERMHDSRGRLDRADSRDLLDAIEQSLKTVKAMRARFVRNFEEDLAKAKAVEDDLLIGANLKANLERHRALFNNVVDQLKQAQLAGDYGNISAQVLEPARALRHPVRPRVALTLALALMAGLVLGAGAAVISDRVEQRIRTPDEMCRSLEFPLIGLIPQLADAQLAASGAIGRISQTSPRSALAEAYKATRTNLEALRRSRRVRVILVTSPRPGDGKSTTTSNLAIALAQAGRRVLLIDSDLRRPSQDRLHGLQCDRGLANLLGGPGSLVDVVQPSAVAGLDILGVGAVPPNPAELLMSPRLVEVLDEARGAYDVVLIDSSPLLAVTDPTILGAVTDSILLVARLGSTSQKDARRSVAMLQDLGIPVLGLVINGFVQSRREASSDGYGLVRPERPLNPQGRARPEGPHDDQDVVPANGVYR